MPPSGRLRDELGEQRVAGEVVAQGGEERLDGDFRALEQLRPGEAGGGGELAEAGALELFGIDLAGGEQARERGHARLLLLVFGPGLVVDEAEAAAVRSEAAVGVVDAQVQAELGARGEHAVGLVGALRNEVVDEDAGVAFGAVHGERRLALEPERGVDAGHDALAGGFFISTGAVDLAGEIEARACI